MQPSISIQAIHAFQDNYIWAIINLNDSSAYVIDPGDSSPVEDFLLKQKVRLNVILITHHHSDHIGGIKNLSRNRNTTVYGPKSDKIPEVTHFLQGGEQLQLPNLRGTIEVLSIPGHTAEHIAYYYNSDHDAANPPKLFCGDTVFSSGCGRIFDGSATELYNSIELIKTLPGNTQLYCAHEYTLANLQFALAIEPENPQLLAKVKSSQLLRQQNHSTLPTTLNNELETNPFFRADKQNVQAAIKEKTGIDPVSPLNTFIELRKWKDHF